MGNNRNNEDKRVFNESYKVINELLPDPPAGVWDAWIRHGQRTLVDGTYIKSRRPWKK